MTEMRALAKTLLLVLAFLLIAVTRAAGQGNAAAGQENTEPSATNAASATTTVIVVRHAEKADASRDPVLSAEGVARAEALAAALADAGVSTIYTTEFARTQLTAQPLAQRLGVTVQVRPLAGRDLDGEARALAEHIRTSHAGETVLVVGHSNTVPAMAAALGAPRLPDLAESDHSTLLVLLVTPDGTRLIRAQFDVPDQERRQDS